MANTFLAAQGYDVGKSLCEHDMAQVAVSILSKANVAKCGLSSQMTSLLQMISARMHFMQPIR